jgi:hypothetical protein
MPCNNSGEQLIHDARRAPAPPRRRDPRSRRRSRPPLSPSPTGFTDPASTKGWGIIDFDWSNSKALWATHKPMDDEEMLFQQVVTTTSASPGTTGESPRAAC